MKNLASMKKNFIASLANTIFIGLFYTGYPLLLGFIFSPNEVANLALILSWTQLISIPVANGIGPAILRYFPMREEKNNNIEFIAFTLSSCYLFFCFLFFLFVFPLFFNLSPVELILIFINLFLNFLHVLFSFFIKSREIFSRNAKIEAISLLFAICSFICLAVFGNLIPIDPVILIMIPVFLNHSIFIVISSIDWFLNYKTNFSFDLGLTKLIIFYMIIVGAGSVASIGLSNIQIIIGESIGTRHELGVFSFWNYLLLPLNLIAISTGPLFLVRISYLSKLNSNIELDFTLKLNYAYSLIIIPLSFTVVLLVSNFHWILDMLTLSKFSADSYWPVIILIILQAFINLLSIPSNACISAKFLQYRPISTITMFIFTVLTWFLTVPTLKFLGLALGIFIGVLLSMIFEQIAVSYEARKWIGFNPLLFGIFLILFIFLNLITQILQLNPLIEIIIIGSIAIPFIFKGFYVLIKIFENRKYNINHQL